MNSYQMLCERLGYSIKNNKNTPIFIHSLWRAGSTYMFNVFRRSDYGYWAYQEPVHEISLEAKNDPSVLDKFTSETLNVLRHPILEKPYFYELQRTHYAWRSFPEKRMILDDYFEKNISCALEEFLRAIILSSEGRPVIQECRTSNRIGTIKSVFGGSHIYLLRNPRDQWDSFKVSNYFMTACLIILGAKEPPKIINMIKKEISYIEFHSDDIQEEFDHFNQLTLSNEHSYLVFYAIWCLSAIEGVLCCDILINMDLLSNSKDYRFTINEKLESMGISGLEMDDCKIPQKIFSDGERKFFIGIEKQIHELLSITGYDEKIIETLKGDRYVIECNDLIKRLNWRLSGISYNSRSF